jgi:hypothetical protein
MPFGPICTRVQRLHSLGGGQQPRDSDAVPDSENRCSAWSKFVDHEHELQAVHQLELVGATPNYPAVLTPSPRHLLSAIAAPSAERHAGDEPLSRCNMARAGDALFSNSSPGGSALISSSTIIVSSSCLIATVEGSLILRPKRWSRMNVSLGECCTVTARSIDRWGRKGRFAIPSAGLQG